MAKINPFRPNYPVHPGMFVGRVDAIRRIERALHQTKRGNPANFMITGERGIGKSSLLAYVKDVAEGKIAGLEGAKLSFVVIDTDIDENTSQLTLVKKIEMGLERALGQTEPARKLLKDAWGFLQRLEAAGVRLKEEAASESEQLLMEEFSYSLSEIVARVCAGGGTDLFSTRCDGILVLIDEADNASRHLSLGSFLKLLCERLYRRGCDRISFGIAGLPELRSILTESHASSLRLFDEVILDRLLEQEVLQVIDFGIRDANRLNTEETSVTAEGKQTLVHLSEGYPHFIQQFAHSAFSSDMDNVIDENDVMRGAVGPGGAMEVIGDRYYRDNFYNKVRKESYRQVLRIMADKLDDWVTKKEIKSKFKGTESTLDNALFALRDRKILLPKEGERGVYRLQHRGFAWWIKLYTADPGDLQQAPNSSSGGGVG